jgi:hypothetical protein
MVQDVKPRCDRSGCDNPRGWTLPQLNKTMRHLKETFPEMPGVLMWGGDRGGCGDASRDLIEGASKLMVELWPDGPSRSNISH